MQEFQYVFVTDRGKVFEVNYRTLASNANPYFTTSAGVFNRPRTDYNRCGQCQDDVLTGEALRFYKKWDKLHLKDLTEAQYNELTKDIAKLTEVYPFYVKTDGSDIPFYKEVETERAYRGK